MNPGALRSALREPLTQESLLVFKKKTNPLSCSGFTAGRYIPTPRGDGLI